MGGNRGVTRPGEKRDWIEREEEEESVMMTQRKSAGASWCSQRGAAGADKKRAVIVPSRQLEGDDSVGPGMTTQRSK
jgi:hypothetical protein